MVNIGVVPDPRGWERWPEAEALLEPARKLGGFDSVLDDDEVLFVVLDEDELLAVATAWLSTQKYVEVKLVGGRDYPRWLSELDCVIGSAAVEAGAAQLCAWGRRGWIKSLRALGWDKISEDADGFCGYARELGGETSDR